VRQLSVLRRLLFELDRSCDQRGWCLTLGKFDGIDIVDQVFLDLIGDLQSITLTDLWSPDRRLTLPARRLTAVRLVQVAIAAHESIPPPQSSPSDADLAKQWRRADDVITNALAWVPPGRAHHVWKTVQTYSRYLEHCELPYIAYLSATCCFWDEAVEKIMKFVHAAEVVTTLETVDFDKYAQIDDEEPDPEFWEQLCHVTRLYIHPVNVPLVPADADPTEFFKAQGELRNAKLEALVLSGLIESTFRGKRWHPLPPACKDAVRAELRLPAKVPPSRRGAPRKLSDAVLLEARKKYPRLGYRELAKQLTKQLGIEVSASTVLRGLHRLQRP